MSRIVTKITIRNDTQERWLQFNPVLLKGELGAETDTGKLKMGDGITSWIDLPYMSSGDSGVVNAQTHYDFPSIGKDNVIYKAESERSIYQWNSKSLKYELISSTEISGDLSEIRVIHGGNAILNQ